LLQLIFIYIKLKHGHSGRYYIQNISEAMRKEDTCILWIKGVENHTCARGSAGLEEARYGCRKGIAGERERDI
jgi:hypothetical protein